MSKEPVAITSGVMGLLSAILMLLVVFGVDLSKEQTAAILGVGNAVLVLIGMFVMRSKVTPV